VPPAELTKQPTLAETGNPCFPVAAKVGKHWWVLRINSFPDHPMWTLFVDGRRVFDVNDVPATWGPPAGPGLPTMADSDVERALAPVRTFSAYGSEVGLACDNLFCCG
jgi:hypothetical protein